MNGIDMYVEQTNTWFFIAAYDGTFNGTGASYEDVCHLYLGMPL